MSPKDSDRGQRFPVKSLLHFAVRKLASDPDLHAELMNTLPLHLKSQLLHVASKRGNLSNRALKSLVHENVIELDLSSCSLSDKALENISVCQQLQKLNLNSDSDELINISSTALKNMFSNLPSLAVLFVRKCAAVTDDVISTLVDHCPLLMELDVSGCSITDMALKRLKNLEQLIALNISSTKISDRGIVSLVRGSCAETLCELRLDNCEGITDFAIEIVVLYCANMKVLLFHGCSVTEVAWTALEKLLSKSKVRHMAWTVY